MPAPDSVKQPLCTATMHVTTAVKMTATVVWVKTRRAILVADSKATTARHCHRKACSDEDLSGQQEVQAACIVNGCHCCSVVHEKTLRAAISLASTATAQLSKGATMSIRLHIKPVSTVIGKV